MILRLNELFPFVPGKIRNSDVFLDNYNYPRQFKNFIGRKIQLKFKDTESGIIFQRMPLNINKFPEFVGTSSEEDIWWKIVRMDCVFPFTCILIEMKKDMESYDFSKTIPRVIVCRSNKIIDLSYYPGYVAAEDEIDINRSSDYDEYSLVSEETWEDFNKAYANDYIHIYPIQDTKYLGLPTYSQYPKNLLKLRYDDILIPDEARDWRDQAWKEVVDKEYDFSEVKYAENHLTVNKFAESYVNVPQRPINKGIIIRCDTNSEGKPHFVVRENSRHWSPDHEIVIEPAYRYITEEDAVVFINTDYMTNNTKESVAHVLEEGNSWG